VKILITGSRNIKDKQSVFNQLDSFVNHFTDIIVHGGATGVDLIAEEWCKQNKVKSMIVRPVHESKKEYYLHRNAEMVGMCDMCLAFWDGKSRGTQFTINYAKQRNLVTKVFEVQR